MKKTIFCIVALFNMLHFGCDNRSERNIRESDRPAKAETVKVPEPMFDKELSELLKDFKKIYKAKGVRIGRPYFETSDGDSNYWLKIELLNPDLGDKTFNELGEEIAMALLDHLTNDQDFEKVEVSVIQKKGFIITFSSSQNAFFYRDSLQIVGN